jgi:hypothetical protein
MGKKEIMAPSRELPEKRVNVPWVSERLHLLRGDWSPPANGKEAIAQLEQCGKDIAVMDGKVRESRYTQIGKAYGIACFLRADSDAWSDVCMAGFWDAFPTQRPKESDKSAALQTAMKIVFGCNDKHTVSRHALALQSPFDSGILAKDIPSLLKNSGGIDGLNEQRKQAAAMSKLARGGLVVVLMAGTTASALVGVAPRTRLRIEARVKRIEGGVLYLSPLKGRLKVAAPTTTPKPKTSAKGDAVHGKSATPKKHKLGHRPASK